MALGTADDDRQVDLAADADSTIRAPPGGLKQTGLSAEVLVYPLQNALAPDPAGLDAPDRIGVHLGHRSTDRAQQLSALSATAEDPHRVLGSSCQCSVG